jgi:hypothetical protein
MEINRFGRSPESHFQIKNLTSRSGELEGYLGEALRRLFFGGCGPLSAETLPLLSVERPFAHVRMAVCSISKPLREDSEVDLDGPLKDSGLVGCR